MPFAAARVVADFDRRTATGTFGEVRLFRALLDSITSAAPDVQVAEYHGGGHQVSHATVRHVGLGVRRCELSDLMVVAFHRNRPVSPRLTFLQAKYERGLHRTSRPPSGNYVQWSLLAGRQPISGCGKFRPPTGLLSGALLPSVGTFGFFVDGASRGARYDLVYSSADVLAPTHSAVVGRHIVDFAVPSARVVIEVDGAHHASRRAADVRRDRELGRSGWRVLRVPSDLVARDVAEAVRRVRAALGGGG